MPLERLCPVAVRKWSLAIGWMAGFLCCASQLAAANDNENDRPPNIVLLLIDDMGWMDPSCYGNSYHETPHMDRLATEGLRFTDFYASGAVCSPTRAGLQTGRHQARYGLTAHIPGHWRPFEFLQEPANARFLPLETTSLAEMLSRAGYRTGYFGKWHLNWNGGSGTGRDYMPGRHGYEEWSLGGRRDAEGDPKRIDDLTAKAVAFIEEHREEPFFLMLSHYAVHIPLEARPDRIRHFVDKPRPSAPGVYNPLYAAMLAHTDDSVGRVLQALDDQGLAGDTLVVLTSDNGGLFRRYDGFGVHISSNEPLRDEKGSLYEGGIRVPAIIRWPDHVTAGAECAAPAVTLDLFPTFAAVAGVDIEAAGPGDGVSLVSLFENPAGGSLDREALYFHYPHYHHSRPAGAVRQGQWKLIEFFDSNEVELYDLSSDLGERRDLSRSMPERARSMRSTLADWRKAIGAAMPEPNPDHDPQRAGEWWSRRSGEPLDIEAMRRRYEAERNMMERWTGGTWQSP